MAFLFITAIAPDQLCLARNNNVMKRIKTYVPFSWVWLLPHYWLLWLFVFIWAAAAYAPRAIRILYQPLLEWFVFARIATKKHGAIAKINISLCLPHLSMPEQEQLMRRHATTVAQVFFNDYPRSALSAKALDKNTTINNRDLLEAGLAKGRGVVLLPTHTSSSEILLSYLLSKYDCPAFSIYRTQRYEVITWALNYIRTRHNRMTLLPRGHRATFIQALTTLKNNGIFCPYLDGPIEGKRSDKEDFFGHPKYSATWLPKILALSGAAVVGLFNRYDAPHDHYHIDLSPLPPPHPDDEIGSAKNINTFYADAVRGAPENFIWHFKIFRERYGNDLYPT